MTETRESLLTLGIPIKSITPLLSRLTAALDARLLRPGDVLPLRVTAASVISDLYSLGRLLAAMHELRDSFALRPQLVLPAQDRQRRLQSLQLESYCRANGFAIARHSPAQTELPLPVISPATVPSAFPRRDYWRVLVPLQALTVPEAKQEVAVAGAVSAAIDTLLPTIEASLHAMSIPSARIRAELARFLHRILRELLSNCFTHSGSPHVVVAATASCESATDVRAHRPRTEFDAGQDKFELLVFDTGCGLLRSLAHSLPHGPTAAKLDRYAQLRELTAEDIALFSHERALMTNVFSGELAVRKGRRSDGLRDVAEGIAWFGGVMHARSGRSELLLEGAGAGHLLARALTRPRSAYFLPGLIASPMLKSNQLQSAWAWRVSHALGPTTTRTVPTLIRIATVIDSSLGGIAAQQFRARAELDAEQLLSWMSIEQAGALASPTAFEIDVQLLADSSVTYLDVLLQELCKRQTSASPRPTSLADLILTNVPRDVAQSLRLRNCEIMMRLSSSYCLALDDTETLHVLGVGRISDHFINATEVLQLLFARGRLDDADLDRLEVTPEVRDYLFGILPGAGGILTSHVADGVRSLISMDILSSLSRRRTEHLAEVNRFIVERSNAIFQLANGSTVDVTYDLTTLWADPARLWDCARLLVDALDIGPIDTVVTFVDNGDRLATAVQRYLGAPHLTVLDPQDSPRWSSAEIQGRTIVLVDSLYPGDEVGGYVSQLLTRMEKEGRPIYRIAAFHDFRSGDISPAAFLRGIPVTSVPNSAVLRLPRLTSPTPGVDIVSHFRLPTSVRRTAAPADETRRDNIASSRQDGTDSQRRDVSRRIGGIELTTEFWQNVSTFRLIRRERRSRDARHLVFFEDNDQFIRVPRMRRVVTDFVERFVRHGMDQRIDVILHPAHSTGAFLAQHAALNAAHAPLILSLPQPRYGGALRISRVDYEQLSDRVAAYRSSLGKRPHERPLRCLIVDDSVVTGTSLTMMAGLAMRLGLRVRGIMVLLNRLPRETGTAIRQLTPRFAHLYRLEMPSAMQGASLDDSIRAICDTISSNSLSAFAHRWALRVPRLPAFAVARFDRLDTLPPPSVQTRLALDNAEHIPPYMLRQIINELILHVNPQVIGFEARSAVTYNFLPDLIREDAFWSLLDALLSTACTEAQESQSLDLLRTIIYMLSYTDYASLPEVNASLTRLCLECANVALSQERAEVFSPLLIDSLMALGALGSAGLARLIYPVLDYAAPVRYAASESADSIAIHAGTRRRAKVSSSVLGALAWSVERLMLQQPRTSLPADPALQTALDAAFGGDSDAEAHLTRIDCLAAKLSVDEDLRDSMRIRHWRPELAAFTLIADESSAAFSFLSTAPGYTCTLASILRVCKADTVVLFARSSGDSMFYVREFASRDQIRGATELRGDLLSEAPFSPRVKGRMRSHLFFYSTHADDLAHVNRFALNSDHAFALGRFVDGGDLEYYVVVGYSRDTTTGSLSFLSAAFYHLTLMTALLRRVLPSIHAKHVTSASSWHALVQSLLPLHRLRTRASLDEPTHSRRRILQVALAGIDVGDKLRRAVRFSAQSVVRMRTVREALAGVADSIETQVRLALDDVKVGLRRNVSWVDDWPIQTIDTPHDDDDIAFCAFHTPLLEFVVLECLINALAYYDSAITATSSIRQLELRAGNTPRYELDVTIFNDRLTDSVEQHGSGSRACKAAATSAGGSFESGPVAGGWLVRLSLPMYPVPSDLTDQLRGFIH